MGTIRFSLRPDKADSQGKQPVELIYQISGKRSCFWTKEKLWPQCWDQTSQRAKYLDRKTAKALLPDIRFADIPTAKDIEAVNNALNDLTVQIRNIEKRHELDNLSYSTKKVIEDLGDIKRPKIKKEEPRNLVYEYIDKYISEHSAVREPGSLQVYRSLKNHLLAFQKQRKVPVSFTDLDASFFRKFQAFLLLPRKELRKGKLREIRLNNTTVAKQLSTLKTFITYAKADKVNVSEDYKNFKVKKPRLEVVALTNEEFETLFHLDLSGNRRLDQVRDIFCFSCATGLRYSDLNQLRREHIKSDEIHKYIQKTQTWLMVPLNPYSSAILEKYKDNHFPLPVSGKQKMISGQKLNKYIKELCKFAGIDEPIEKAARTSAEGPKIYPKYELVSIHTGRKTFVTVSLERGVPVQEVMATSGHSDYKSFSRYVNVTEKRKKEAMQKAWGVIAEPQKKKPSKLKAV